MTGAAPVIGLNLLYLLPGVVGGTETYARELLGALARIPDGFRFRAFVNEEARDWPLPDGFERVVCPVRAASRPARYRWEQLELPRWLKARPVALLHSLGYTAPVRLPVPGVVTVHDLNFMRHAEMGWVRRMALGGVVRLAARRSTTVVTISAFSRREIIEELGIPENRVVVTPLAAEIGAPPPPAAVESARERYDLRRPYVLAFGAAAKHKNIEGLIGAFTAVASEIPHDLALVGHLPAGALDTVPPELASRFRTTGYVPAADVAPLIAGAEGLVFPSFYEGFGIPVLNAQAVGVPVAAARAGALPEVGGAAAIYFDPASRADMANALRALVAPGPDREARIGAGYANAARFDWLDTARATLGVYRSALASSAPSLTRVSA